MLYSIVFEKHSNLLNKLRKRVRESAEVRDLKRQVAR